MSVLAAFSWGGWLGLVLLVVGISVFLWLRPEGDGDDERCDCTTCAGARAWAERYRGYL